jgi:Pyridoxamine 5'-phosphate oxidase
VTTPDRLSWSEVCGLLAPARNYWLCTTRPDGAPHAAPVWGVVTEDVWYAYTEVDTVKARNIQADPPEVDAIVAAFAAKYTDADDQQYLPVGPPSEVVLALRPDNALVWALSAYDDSQRRWTVG